MKTQALRERIGGGWERRADGWWRRTELAQLRAAATEFRTAGTRFAALTVRPEGSDLRLAWHWDAAGVLLTLVAYAAPDQPVPSLVDLWPGADWAEREARDYYAVTFSGRAGTPPLMLREGDQPGVLLRGEDGQ